jgi:DNA-binding CsgD family transcriptional regulator
MESTSTRVRYRSGDNFTERLSTERRQTPEGKGRWVRPRCTAVVSQDSTASPRPMFTVEESIVMRAVSGGKSDKQVCIALRMPLQSFHGLLRDLMAKTGTRDRVGLLVWAVRERQGGDSRESERHYKWKRPGLRNEHINRPIA